MALGGRRPGAGRKPGSKAQATKQALEAAGQGEMPLEYMLRVMRDPTADEKRRDQMAQAAAGYIHPKLSNVTGNFTHTHEPTELSRAELLDIARAGRSGTSAQGNGAGKPDSVHPVH